MRIEKIILLLLLLTSYSASFTLTTTTFSSPQDINLLLSFPLSTDSFYFITDVDDFEISSLQNSTLNFKPNISCIDITEQTRFKKIENSMHYLITSFYIENKFYIVGKINILDKKIEVFDTISDTQIFLNEILAIGLTDKGNYLLSFSSLLLGACMIYELSFENAEYSLLKQLTVDNTGVSFQCDYSDVNEVYLCVYASYKNQEELFIYLLNKKLEFTYKSPYVFSFSGKPNTGILVNKRNEFFYLLSEGLTAYVLEISLKKENMLLYNYGSLLDFTFGLQFFESINSDIFAIYGATKSSTTGIIHFFSRKSKQKFFSLNWIALTKFNGITVEGSTVVYFNYFSFSFNFLTFSLPTCVDVEIKIWDDDEHVLDLNLLVGEDNSEEGGNIEISFYSLDDLRGINLIGLQETNGEGKAIKEDTQYSLIKYQGVSQGTYDFSFFLTETLYGIQVPSLICLMRFENICYDTCGKCREKGDKNDNKCLECKVGSYFMENTQNCVNAIPEGHYFDAGIIKACYKTCFSCSSKGNDSNHNCESCKENFVFQFLYTRKEEDKGNCILMCNTESSLWLYNTTNRKVECFNNSTLCPIDFPFLNAKTKECVMMNVEGDDLELRTNLNETLIMELLSKKKDELFLNSDQIVSGKWVISKYLIKDKEVLSSPQKSTNKFSGSLTKVSIPLCEKILRNKYKLPLDSYLILIILSFVDPVSLKEISFYILIYDEKWNKLDDSLCSSFTYETSVSISTDPKKKTLLSNGISLFNTQDVFFNDYCTSHSFEGKDTTVFERRKEFFLNDTICNSNCKFQNFNEENGNLKCVCERLADEEMYFTTVPKSNIKLLKCYKLFGSSKVLKSPIFIFFIASMVSQLCLMGFALFFYKVLKKKTKSVTFEENYNSSRVILTKSSKMNRTVRFSKFRKADAPLPKGPYGRIKISKPSESPKNAPQEVSIKKVVIVHKLHSFFEIMLIKSPIFTTFISKSKVYVRLMKISFFIFDLIVRSCMSIVLVDDERIGKIYKNNKKIDYCEEIFDLIKVTMLSVLNNIFYKLLIYVIIKTEEKHRKLREIAIGIFFFLVIVVQGVCCYYSIIYFSVYPHTIVKWIVSSSASTMIYILIIPLICTCLVCLNQLLIIHFKIYFVVHLNTIILLL